MFKCLIRFKRLVIVILSINLVYSLQLCDFPQTSVTSLGLPLLFSTLSPKHSTYNNTKQLKTALHTKEATTSKCLASVLDKLITNLLY